MSVKTGKGFSMRIRNVFDAGYYRYMRFKQYIKLISGNQIIQEKLAVINFFDHYGSNATKDAYGVARSTIYNWKKTYKDSKFNPATLIPKSTRPNHSRRMIVDENILSFIKNLRLNNYPMGKSKIKPLLDAYCCNLAIQSVSESLIGKIIKRNGWSYGKRSKHTGKYIKKKKRMSSKYKPKYMGDLVQIDTVVRFDLGIKRYILTAVDVFSRFGFAYTYTGLSSRIALDFMHKLESVAPFVIKSVKTDNGCEFLGEFDNYLNKTGITHFFSYPRTPKSNGYVERFNRTIQEEFVDDNIEYIEFTKVFNQKLADYLIYFNTVRPHLSLDKMTPMAYLVFKGVLSNMSVANTRTFQSRPFSYTIIYTL